MSAAARRPIAASALDPNRRFAFSAQTESAWGTRRRQFGSKMLSSSAAQIKGSSRPHFQPNADLSAIVFREMDTGLLKSFLYFEDG